MAKDEDSPGTVLVGSRAMHMYIVVALAMLGAGQTKDMLGHHDEGFSQALQISLGQITQSIDKLSVKLDEATIAANLLAQRVANMERLFDLKVQPDMKDMAERLKAIESRKP